ncbi:Fungal transcriptional regulatory protein [Beauveria brongniartii RCEF 3172]|uniref:Fungal transcriptional regulatory protein n=1 Tax=Beauveria brongniartii RCEF 3172 TaxID=1081107 RepID=A0A167JU17_9HYPO|nr:Fungal transcriptional regulatory protein [Beauveria brongniartii RCEF 3172]
MNEVMLEMCDMNAQYVGRDLFDGKYFLEPTKIYNYVDTERNSDVMTRHATLHGVVGKKPRKVSWCDATESQELHARDATLPVGHANIGAMWMARPRSAPRPFSSSTSGTRPAHHDTPGAGGAAYELPALPVEGIVPTVNTVPDSILTFPVDSSLSFSTDPSESFFGWDMGDVGSDDMDFLNVSLLEWFPTAVNEETHESLPEPAGSDESESPSSQLMRDAQPPDTPWPHVYHPSGRDVQINLSTAAPKTPSILQQPQLGHVKESSRQAIISLVSTTHQPNWPAVDFACFPSTETLSICINLYFRHFHDTLPILRRVDLPNRESSPVLLLAMAAIGAMYSRDAALRSLALALNELARRAISSLSESNRSASFSVSFVQATLLQSMFGLFCGSRMLYQHAEMSRGSLVTAARRMHLLRPGLSFVQELQKESGTPTQKQIELASAADDERRSLGWGIYLYDMQISALLNIPPLFSISEINVALPANLNATSNPQSTTESPPSFRAVLDTLLSTDAAAVEAIFTSTQSPGDSRYRLDFPATFKHNPQKLLDELAISCHSLNALPNPLTIGVCALSHLGHLQFTWPAFLNNAKIAAGKSGTEESKASARAWIRSRVSVDPAGARFILTQAGQLGALLARYPFDAPAETVLCLDVALTFWAALKFSTNLGGVGGGGTRQKPFSIFWSNCDDASEWVKHGGAVYFQGLGELGELTSAKSLAIFRQRMDIMSWGLAERFKHVLLNLEKEEQAL